MTTPLARTFSVLALAAGLTLSAAATAAAETLTVSDARGDVHSFTGESDTATPEPRVKNGDILRTVLRHNTGRISARVKLAEVNRVGDMRGEFMRLVTNEGVRRDVMIYAGPNMWRGETQMFRPNGQSVDCDITHKIDYETNLVTVSFPRSCVSSPRWVRIGLGSTWTSGGFRKHYFDDGQISDGLNPARFRLSPRLSRG